MFITFEGMEGSGKSTAMARIGAWLEASAHEVVYTREPGGSELGRNLRGILLDASNSDIVPTAELFLYLADRAQHTASLVRPALERGAIVLSDRFADSTIVYQGYGRGLDIPVLEKLNTVAVNGTWPDLTLLFDLDEETGLARANARNTAEGKAVSEGRFEAEGLAFHTRIREGFLDWAARHSERFSIINANQSMDAVFDDAKKAIATRLVQNNQ
jgi:thymidylate kinase